MTQEPFYLHEIYAGLGITYKRQNFYYNFITEIRQR
jgi:hypothetical protein